MPKTVPRAPTNPHGFGQSCHQGYPIHSNRCRETSQKVQYCQRARDAKSVHHLHRQSSGHHLGTLHCARCSVAAQEFACRFAASHEPHCSSEVVQTERDKSTKPNNYLWQKSHKAAVSCAEWMMVNGPRSIHHASKLSRSIMPMTDLNILHELLLRIHFRPGSIS